ncbi:Glycosyl hydrolase family 71 [Microdochium nivale]|nr:Glycosyl hydrolase family 71 [Microdochium nivale]
MRLSKIVTFVSLGCSQVTAFAVFAHFMVGNTLNYGYADWEADIVAAQQAGIDAFALNIAKDEQANIEIEQAFQVAVARKFRLFFSFDYAGLGDWDKAKVKNLINTYKGSPAYYIHENGKPLVSTFEGPGAAADWRDIKSATGCFFVPDWSSLGAKRAALDVGAGIIDGLFSWEAWPWGPTDMNTHGDASYMQFLAQAAKPTYMMPISPLFYTNLPFWNKNWMWRGDDLWFDRWMQVLYMTRIQKDFAPPAFAQIISWNDFGESHYIGPLVTKALYAFDTGKASFRYADGVNHDGFRRFLPFLIQLSKTGSATVGTQGVTMWYRNSAALACTYSGTVGNTATQLQREFSPAGIVADKVFYSALLGSAATVTVTVGGVSLNAAWTDTPPGGVGLYHGSASFAGRAGEVVVTVNGVATVKGSMPIGACTRQNFNPYVYSASGPSSSASLNINGQVCVQGFGINAFVNICKFSCALGYCPVTACTCSRIGPQPKRPTALQKDGFPTNGDRNFEGLCSFAVNYGYTGAECTSKKPASCPDTATSGTGNTAAYNSMCSFSCRYGWCPINLCTPKSYGTLVDLPAPSPKLGTYHVDTDSCYNIPAVNCAGQFPEGLEPNDLTTGCRESEDLNGSNVYSRRLCNSGWCAYMYAYYFEKDYASAGIGHRHDWEHIIVWIPDEPERERWVCASQHTGYECLRQDSVRWLNGDHPKVVYHKDKSSTHTFRMAGGGDDNIENHSGQWLLADLVSWRGIPDGIRAALVAHDFGSATLAIKDNTMASAIDSALCGVLQGGSPNYPTCPLALFPYDFDPTVPGDREEDLPDGTGSCR